METDEMRSTSSPWFLRAATLAALGLYHSSAAWAAPEGCYASPISGVALAQLLNTAERQWGELDTGAFNSTMDHVLNLAVNCLSEVPSRTQVAQLHRLVGLQTFATGQGDQNALESFAAAKALDPDYIWPTSLIPADHRLNVLYEEAWVRATVLELREPATGTLYLDGIDRPFRLEGTATLYQQLDDSAQPLVSRYLFSWEPQPSLVGEEASSGDDAEDQQGQKIGWIGRSAAHDYEGPAPGKGGLIVTQGVNNVGLALTGMGLIAAIPGVASLEPDDEYESNQLLYISNGLALLGSSMSLTSNLSQALILRYNGASIRLLPSLLGVGTVGGSLWLMARPNNLREVGVVLLPVGVLTTSLWQTRWNRESLYQYNTRQGSTRLSGRVPAMQLQVAPDLKAMEMQLLWQF